MLLASISDAIRQDGIAISFTGLFIVFTALSLITLFIAKLPAILEVVNRIMPEPEPPAISKPAPLRNAAADEELAVAIGSALHASRTQG